ncbi:MAG TPA: RNA polymerase sigma factor [Myxococcaceae bacterium]|nr:RNA polymerase sigma factor [Myxococcaceae bacterium]
MEPSDEELMHRFRVGDGAAFPALVERHRARVFAFVLRLTQDRGRAEDVLQETWLRVVRGAAGWQPTARFTTWVYTIARNLCLDSLRRDQHRAADPLPGDPPDAGSAWSDPERGARAAELRPLLESAVAALPPEQREVFLLREVAGVPFKEIARVTGAPEPTVKSRMRYALEALRAHLGRAGVDSESPGRTAS